MTASADIAPRANYPAQLLAVSGGALTQLVRAPSHSHRSEAARKLARHSLWLSMAGAALVIALMVAFDRTEIQLMPARGTPGLWPIRILTDFGKDEYVLSVLGGALVVLALVAAWQHGTSRTLLLGLGTRLQFVFLSVALSVFIAEILKYLIGRGRPFVGGKANPFNFIPFEGTGAYASLPSGHAVTAFALAFAVSALARGGKIVVSGLMGGNFSLPMVQWIYKRMTIEGFMVGTLAEAHELMALARGGKIRPTPMREEPMSDAQKWIDELRAGKVVGRIVLKN